MEEDNDEVLLSIVIFIVLIVGTFSVWFYFPQRSATGALIYEQGYAKEIALLIDSSKPGMEYVLDFSDGIEIAQKNEYGGENVFVDENSVTVKLANKGGYKFEYFSDYLVEAKVDKEKLILSVKDE